MQPSLSARSGVWVVKLSFCTVVTKSDTHHGVLSYPSVDILKCVVGAYVYAHINRYNNAT